MKWPKLVPKTVRSTYVKVYLSDGIDENGAEKHTLLFEGMCNYSEKSRQVMTAQKQLVQLNAQAFFDGDIYPGNDIYGEVEIGAGNTTRRRIYGASRGRNPDGTVNFTWLELI